MPLLINSLVLGKVSLARIKDFLLREEIDNDQVSLCESGAIVFENVDLGWFEDEKIFTGLNFNVKPGELVAGL